MSAAAGPPGGHVPRGEGTGTILALGGGGFSTEPENPRLDTFALSLARAENPRVCFLPTASGDSEAYVADFYHAFSALPCRPADLRLFRREHRDLAGFLLAQDVIYVGGGNTANLLAVWRAHGLPDILRRAHLEGIVLCGISAGMNCWFQGSVTDSYGPELAALPDGLGLIPGSACPHYDGEPGRRPTYHRLVAEGTLPGGWAADDGAALLFRGAELAEVVSSRPEAAGYRVTRTDGRLEEERLPARLLPG